MTDLARPLPHLSSLSLRIKGGMDVSRIQELELSVAPAFKRDGVQVLLDITGVTSMDATGLDWLLRTQDELERRNGALKVVAVGGGALSRLFSLTGLDEYLHVFARVFDTEQDLAAGA